MTTDAVPQTIHSKGPEGEQYTPFTLRDELHNGRPAWDQGLHHSLCWTPYDDQTEYGFWSVANLWTRDDKGQATGIVFQTPERPHIRRAWLSAAHCDEQAPPAPRQLGARPPVGRRPHVGGADGGAVRLGVCARSPQCVCVSFVRSSCQKCSRWSVHWTRV